MMTSKERNFKLGDRVVTFLGDLGVVEDFDPDYKGRVLVKLDDGLINWFWGETLELDLGYV